MSSKKNILITGGAGFIGSHLCNRLLNDGNKIICLDIRNDCLDISGAKIKGTQLTIDKSYDKGLSIGENSNVNIKDLLIKNSRVGVAVKDGSIVYLENIVSVNNDYDIALLEPIQ